MSGHNVTNPDKPNLVNYTRKVCNIQIFKGQIFVGKTLTIQHPFIKFVRLFQHQSYSI